MIPIEELRDWYRGALRNRVRYLEETLADLRAGSPSATREIRGVVQQLRGSGGTYGFPEISEGALLVERGRPDQLVRRTVGFVQLLREVAWRGEGDEGVPWRWLHRAAGLPDDPGPASVLEGAGGAGDAWGRVVEASGRPAEAVLATVAEALDVEVADLDERRSGSERVLPGEVALEHLVLPLEEDPARLVVATPVPVDLLSARSVEEASGREIVMRLALPAPVRAALERTYRRGSRRGRRRTDAPGAGGETVLVVEDDPGTRLLVRSGLEARDFRVLEAADGEEALGIVREGGGVDLVVADLYMPRMGGRELIGRLREMDDPPPVVVVTGAGDRESEVRLMEEGAADYIRKPVDPRLLGARVAAVLRRGAPAPA